MNTTKHKECIVQSAPVNSTTGNSTSPLNLTTRRSPLTPYVKNNPKFNHPPSSTKQYSFFFVKITGADCNISNYKMHVNPKCEKFNIVLRMLA